MSLGYEVIRTCGERRLPINTLIAEGDGDDAHVRKRVSEAANDVQAAKTVELEVDQRNIRVQHLRCVQTGLTIRRRRNHCQLRVKFQQKFNFAQELCLIFNEKDINA